MPVDDAGASHPPARQPANRGTVASQATTEIPTAADATSTQSTG